MSLPDHRRHRQALCALFGSPGFISGLLIVLSLVTLVACSDPEAPARTPEPTATLTPTATPSPTPTPTPTPTATPVPPAQLTLRWPETVSVFEPVPVEVLLEPPSGSAIEAQIRATVMDPKNEVYATFELTEREGDLYRSPDLLRLPFDALPGAWWFFVHVSAPVPVVGDAALFFHIAPIVYRDLSDVLPPGVTIEVPVDFTEVVAQGDLWAGGRVWQYGDGEVALWWVPGPVEDFLVSNALVVLEATYDAHGRLDALPSPLEALPVEWQGRPGFEFPEVWPVPDGGHGRAWVIQGSDYWLYVLRVRAVGTPAISTFHEEIAKTFAFVEVTD
jgi:hypothetical protein